jgi:hypothetical protein
MKKMLVLCSLVLLAVFAGCGSAPAPQESSQSFDPNLPDFVMNPPLQDDVLFGVGSARLSSTNQSMTFAEARARQSLASQISINVQAMLTDYSRDAGGLNDKAALELAENVGRQIIDTTLTGAVPVKREKTPDGNFWVMVQMRKSEASRIAADIIDTEAARYAEFKAMEALKMMDAQLNKTTTRPEIVSQ